MKKLLSLLLVLAMVLGMGTAAFAAYPDATGNKYEASILKVSQLGVFEGTDGKFNPNATITRAEFAAVMVRTLGLESAALALAGTPTKFTDVPASHWAAGYVNIAVAKGLSTGTSATTFSPSDPVTCAQVITMLVRGMNRDSQAVGTWPIGHIMVASQLNLMSGLTFSMNAPALRCEVAKYIDNALTKAHLVEGEDGVMVETSSVTYLAMLTSTVLTGTVTDVNTDDDEFTITHTGDTPTHKYPLADGVEIFGSTFANLMNQDVQVVANSDGEAIFVKLTTTAQVIGKVTAVDTVAKTITVNGTVYTVLGTADVLVNGDQILGDAVTKINALKTADVTLVLNDEGKVSYANATKLGDEYVISAKRTMAVNGKTYNIVTVNGADYIIGASTVIVRNGASATYANLKVGDKIKLAVDADVALVASISTLGYVDAFGVTVTGVLAEKATVNGLQKVKIGGTYYEIAIDPDTDEAYSTALSNFTSATVGNYITVTLDRDGKFIAIATALGTVQVRTIAGTSDSMTSTGPVRTISTTDGSVFTVDNAHITDVTVNRLAAGFADLAAGQKIMLDFDVDTGKVEAMDAFADGSATVDAPVFDAGLVDHMYHATGAHALNVGAGTVLVTSSAGLHSELKVDPNTDYTVNGIGNGDLSDILDDTTVLAADAPETFIRSTVSWTWDLSDFATNGGVVSTMVIKNYDVTSAAIVGMESDDTTNTIIVRKGDDTSDVTLTVPSNAKIEVGGVLGKTYADLVIGQKISYAETSDTLTFATITTDTTAPKLTEQAGSGAAVIAKLSEDATVTAKVYDEDGNWVVTLTDTFAKASAATLFTVTKANVGGIAGDYFVVLTAVDAAGNTSAPVSVEITVAP